MKNAAALTLLAALLAGSASAAESAQRPYKGYRYYARHAPVYSVYRSPRFVPAPTPPQPFFFEFFPTNRVNTHMY